MPHVLIFHFWFLFLRKNYFLYYLPRSGKDVWIFFSCLLFGLANSAEPAMRCSLSSSNQTSIPNLSVRHIFEFSLSFHYSPCSFLLMCKNFICIEQIRFKPRHLSLNLCANQDFDFILLHFWIVSGDNMRVLSNTIYFLGLQNSVVQVE